MAAEFMTGLSIFQTLLNMTKGLKDINDAAIRNAAVVELTEKILAAQAAQMTLVARVNELEAELAKREEWKAQKQRYQLTDYGGGTFAYALKPEAAEGEPPHRACPACFQNAQISVLQFKDKNYARQDEYVCPACKTEFALGPRNEPPRPSVRHSGNWMA